MNAPTRNGVARYDTVAVTLHWLIAVVLFAQLYTGWVFSDLPRGDERALWFEWHRTLGFAVLILSVLRLIWRLVSPPPRLPGDLPVWERTLARLSHVLFYVVLIAVPLTGWVYVSTGSTAAQTGMTTLVGGVPWPIIPGLPSAWHRPSASAHVILVWATVILLVVHVAAALKHQFFDRSRVANRMPPFRI